jgi:hypothetical protein
VQEIRVLGIGTCRFHACYHVCYGYLIVYRVPTIIVHNDPDIFMSAIAMSGAGCITTSFFLSHKKIVSTEEKPVKDLLSAGYNHREKSKSGNPSLEEGVSCAGTDIIPKRESYWHSGPVA